MTPSELTNELEGLINKYKTSHSKVCLAYLSHDLRSTIFKKTIITLSNTMMSSMALDNYFSCKEFWNRHLISKNSTESDIKATLEELNTFYKLAFFHANFSILESTLRILVRTIDPAACKNGTSEFKIIYEYLLTKLSLKEYLPFLELFRNLRNVIHNNGYYFHKSNKNEPVYYKDKTYHFEIGKTPAFPTYPFIIDLVKNDQHDLYTKIISHEIFATIALIEDTSIPTQQNI